MRAGILAAVLLLTLAPAAAEDGVPVRRHVIALVEGKEPDPAVENAVHQVLETPLNHLGMVVLHHYIRTGPPPAAWLDRARAVLTYFPGEGEAPAWLWPWLENEVAPRGLRVIHFGEFGCLARPDAARLKPWLARFGLEYRDVFAEGPLLVTVQHADERSSRYEADPRAHAIHHGPRSTGERNRVWVTTRRRGEPDNVCHPVVTGPWGGLALDPWAVRLGAREGDRRWYLDPFLFLRDALGLERVPAPHPSVLNGRRLWFLQVDGDGFESLSSIRPNASCAEIMDEEVFRRYALPYTVSIIVRSLTLDYRVEKPTRLMELASGILHLENVEPASHGVLHTLNWQPDPRQTYAPDELKWYARLENYEYSETAEVRDSIRFINERLLEGRRCVMMLWTGSANPTEGPLAAARRGGCLNLNGGIFRWDDWTDSVGYVSPWSRQVGAELQVYAGAPNENVYDGFFDTMPGAFAHVDTTIERCGTPRILKPADLYIHFYSAENPARMKAIHDLIRRWAFEEPTAPVFASVYARAVNSAVLTAKVFETPDGWLLRDFGDCRTARLDGETREVDFARSRGLLGSRRIGESLYLHLAGPDARVVLDYDPPRHPHVREANCVLQRARLLPTGVSVTATGHARRLVVFAGFRPGDRLLVGIGEEEREEQADAEGAVTVTLEQPGTTPITVRRRR